MTKRLIEAFLDQQARKLIAEELRSLYRSDDEVPENLREVVNTLDGAEMRTPIAPKRSSHQI